MADEMRSWTKHLFGRLQGISDVADVRQLLHERVTLYLKVFFWMALTFMSVFVGSSFISSQKDALRHGSVWNLGAVAAVGLAWLYCRRSEPSAWVLHGIEGTGTVLLSTAFAIPTAALPIQIAPDLICVITTTSILSLRAALVPSSAARTLVVGIAACVPALVLATLRYPTIPRSPNLSFHEAYLLRSYLWAGSAVVLTTVTSSVIYGLRRRFRQALKLGQYSLERKLGEGGMGSVYQGTHLMLRRPTAIKVVKRASAPTLARFEREVLQTSRLVHPNTIAIYDYGRTPDDLFYCAMEFIDGFTLEQLIDLDGPQSPARVVQLIAQAAGSLAEAHGLGLVHRDIKPANIMLSKRGGIVDFVTVLDFGLVKEFNATGSVTLTHDNVITGTPGYMAPEALLDPNNIDGRADLYALGAVAYTLLTGRDVFEGNNLVEVLSKHVGEAPRPPSEVVPGVPGELEAIILECLAKDRRQRPPDAETLRARLLACSVGSWDAAKWWAERAPELRAQLAELSEFPAEATPLTVELDLTNRE